MAFKISRTGAAGTVDALGGSLTGLAMVIDNPVDLRRSLDALPRRAVVRQKDPLRPLTCLTVARSSRSRRAHMSVA